MTRQASANVRPPARSAQALVPAGQADDSTGDFRRLVHELTALLTYEATKDLPTETVRVETPLEWTEVERISGKKVAVCPVLRAGVGMLDGFLGLV